MANKVYSFTKVRKQRTKSGVYSLVIGIDSLILLAFLIGFGIYKSGQMTGMICLLPYVSMAASIFCALKTRKDMDRMDVSGKYLEAGYRVCVVSSLVHAGIFMIGILKVIL